MNLNERLNRRLQIVGELDFRSEQMRRVDGVLTEIKLQAETLLQSIQQLRDAGQFEAAPRDVEDYQHLANVINNQARLL